MEEGGWEEEGAEVEGLEEEGWAEERKEGDKKEEETWGRGRRAEVREEERGETAVERWELDKWEEAKAKETGRARGEDSED